MNYKLDDSGDNKYFQNSHLRIHITKIPQILLNSKGVIRVYIFKLTIIEFFNQVVSDGNNILSTFNNPNILNM